MEQFSRVIFAISPILAMRGHASFEGTNIHLRGDFGDTPEMRFNNILSNVPFNVVSLFQNDLFSRKMGPLLIDQLNKENTDLIKHSIILLLINQKPRDWKLQVQSYIASVPKNSFYLMDVYRALLCQYRYSFSSHQTIEDIKYLLKMIIIKHIHGVKDPGIKAIKKVSDDILPSRITE
jgi:hypothetical protein